MFCGINISWKWSSPPVWSYDFMVIHDFRERISLALVFNKRHIEGDDSWEQPMKIHALDVGCTMVYNSTSMSVYLSFSRDLKEIGSQIPRANLPEQFHSKVEWFFGESPNCLYLALMSASQFIHWSAEGPETLDIRRRCRGASILQRPRA